MIGYRPMPYSFFPLVFQSGRESPQSNKTLRSFLMSSPGKIEGAAKPSDLEWYSRDMFSATTLKADSLLVEGSRRRTATEATPPAEM
jgi:hypothetical protein